MGTPARLKVPSVQARSARSVIGREDLEFLTTDPRVFYVPVVQWAAFTLRGLCTGANAVVDIAYCRPGRETLRVPLDDQTPPMPPAAIPTDPALGPNLPEATAAASSDQGDIEAYEYTTGQPTTATLALVADAEGDLPVIEADHVGENWLKVTITPASIATVIRFLDISGVNVGTYS
jgi:hypothetical protein